jgi:hypothetical protein
VGRVIRGISGAVDALELGSRLAVPAILRISGVFATLITIHSFSIDGPAPAASTPSRSSPTR